MAALIKAGLTLAKNFIKKMAKEYVKSKARDKAKNSGIIKFLLIFSVSLVLSVPLVMFAIFGNLICTFSNCEGDTGKKEDVIDISTMKDIASRMERLRTDINNEAANPGDNYGTYSIKLDDNEDTSKDTTKEENPKEELVENSSKSSATVQHADWHKWVVGETTNVNEGLLGRLADVGQYYNKQVIIHSGWRHYSEQNELYQCWLRRGTLDGKRCNLAANPLQDSHVLGEAADVTGWLQQVPSSEIERFGVAKEVTTENWHIQAKGYIYVPRDQRINYTIDGYGVPQGIVDMMYAEAGISPVPKVNPSLSSDAVVSGGSPSSSSGSGGESEAYIHLLALQQADELDLTALTEEDLNSQEKKGTNLGKTWTLAKGIEKDIQNGTYNSSDIIKRAKDENWGTKEYVKLARWEIQKCFLIGDNSKKGFFETIFGGPKPCNYVNSKVPNLVPEKLQGVVSKTSARKVCEETKDGKCTSYKTETTVTYTDVQELLFMYKDLSLFDNKKEFKPTMKEILETLYDRTAGPTSQGSSSGGANYTPTFISPLEKGTYEVEKKYGDSLDDGGSSKGIYFKVNRLTPIYASIGSQIKAVYKDETGKNTILLFNSTNGYVEYKGVSEVLKKSGTVQQGQLLGSINKDTLMELRTCTKVSDNKQQPTCVNSSNPESGSFKITLQPGIDDKVSKEREKSYASWRTKKDAVYMPGFSSISNLGKLSAEYESSGDPGICVMDTAAGGLQCGTYQISVATGTMDDFLNYLKDSYPQYYQKLAGVPKTIGPFGNAWRALYNSDKTGFAEAQHNYIGTTHYLDIANKIKKKYGYDVTQHNIAVQEMIWSFSVQHRGHTLEVWAKVIGTNGNNLSEKEIIERMYNERMVEWPLYVKNRYIPEKKKALNLLASTS